MIDSQVQQLAKEVYSGSLSAAGPLLDRLSETSDPRIHRLNWCLGQLVVAAQGTKETSRHEGGKVIARGRTTGRSPEEIAYRTDETRFRAWMSFSGIFEVMFWAELNGLMPLQALAEAEELLNAPKQAKRLETSDGNKEDYPSEDGSSYSSTQAFP